MANRWKESLNLRSIAKWWLIILTLCLTMIIINKMAGTNLPHWFKMVWSLALPTLCATSIGMMIALYVFGHRNTTPIWVLFQQRKHKRALEEAIDGDDPEKK